MAVPVLPSAGIDTSSSCTPWIPCWTTWASPRARSSSAPSPGTYCPRRRRWGPTRRQESSPRRSSLRSQLDQAGGRLVRGTPGLLRLRPRLLGGISRCRSRRSRLSWRSRFCSRARASNTCLWVATLDATAATPAFGATAAGVAFGAIAAGPESSASNPAGDNSRSSVPSRRAPGSVDAAVSSVSWMRRCCSRVSASPAPAATCSASSSRRCMASRCERIASRSSSPARPSTCARRARWVESISWSTCSRARPPSWLTIHSAAEGRRRAAMRRAPSLSPAARSWTASASRAFTNSSGGTFESGSPAGIRASLHGSAEIERLADGGDVQASGGQGAPSPLGAEPLRGLEERLVGELERSPVHGDETAGAQIDEGLHGLLRVHVLLLHEPGGVIGPDGEQGRVQIRKPLPDPREAVEIGGVSRVVDARARTLDHESPPERLVHIEESAPAPVLRRNEGHPHPLGDPLGVPPADVAHWQRQSLAEPRSGDHGSAHREHRRAIEMIVVAVRDQRGVDARELRGPQRRRHVAGDEVGDAFAEHGIDQQGGAVELHQPARMPEPGDPRRLAG